MASAIIGAISGILTLFEAVETVQGWAAGDAPAAVTLEQLSQIVQGDDATFFTLIASADLDHYRRLFYQVWLPTVVDFSKSRDITQNDVESGSLRQTFNDINSAIEKIHMTLNCLRAVFEERHGVLHMDDLTRGFYACLNGYALLLHMHGVSAQLNCIRLDAASLDDGALVQDSLSGLQYLSHATGFLNWFVHNSIILDRRLGFVPKTVRGFPGPGYYSYEYRDTYSPLPTISPDLELSVPSPAAHYEDRHYSLTKRVLQQRIANVTNRVTDVVSNPYAEAWQMFNKTNDRLKRRAEIQSVMNVARGRRLLQNIRLRARARAFSGVVDETHGEELTVDCEGADGFSEGVCPDDDPFSITPPKVLLHIEESSVMETEDAAQSSIDH